MATKERQSKQQGVKGTIFKKEKEERLSVFEVVQIIRDKNIKTRTELVALAECQRKNRKRNLAEFIANRGYHVVNDALFMAEEFDEVESAVNRSKKDRIQILQEQLTEKCPCMR